MRIARTVDEIKRYCSQARGVGQRIGLVPTMGALHAGHISLIDAAAHRCEFVVVSLFVNPTQFGPGEDLDRYPRPFEEDMATCRAHGVDVVFAPTPLEMYPQEQLAWVSVEKLTEPLCGRSRPGHFRGVTTVCAKLFNIVGPDVAFFGQKDAQQALVVRRMVTDLNMPLEIAICPTVREPDGLALSSRNRYLSPQERQDALLIYRSLQACREMIQEGTTDAAQCRRRMRSIIEQAPAFKIEYISIVEAEGLTEVERIEGHVLVAVAARIGSTRLIDNILVDTASK